MEEGQKMPFPKATLQGPSQEKKRPERGASGGPGGMAVHHLLGQRGPIHLADAQNPSQALWQDGLSQLLHNLAGVSFHLTGGWSMV